VAKASLAVRLASVAQLEQEMTRALDILKVYGSESDEGKAAITVLDECTTEVRRKLQELADPSLSQVLKAFKRALILQGVAGLMEKAFKFIWDEVSS
jgi:hypothetical protein